MQQFDPFLTLDDYFQTSRRNTRPVLPLFSPKIGTATHLREGAVDLEDCMGTGGSISAMNVSRG